jgi:hypothetical protein
VRRAVLPIADAALGNLKAYEGDPRIVISATLRMLVGRLGDPRLIAIPKLIMREVVNFPELAEMYRREVLERIIPIVTGRIEWGIEHGYFRPVDPELTIRSIVGPILLHLLMAEVFGLMPADGLALDRLVENHLTILFDGLSTGTGAAH